MKKSEFINKLAEIDFEWWSLEDEDDFKNLIKVLLDKAEALGMAPPSNPTTTFNGGHLCQWEYEGENHE